MPFAVTAILALSGCALVIGLALCLGVWLVRWLVRRRRPEGYWRRVGRAHLVLVPAYVFLIPPLVLASLARWQTGTRPDERGYDGPRVDAAGRWSFQSRRTLREERDGGVVDPAVRSGAAATEARIETADGLALRGFLVEAAAPPRFQAVLVHGLFRGALELERPASWLHELGGDVLMLEMRNHGGSARGAPGFGSREREDVLAAVRFLRGRGARGRLPLVLYGVSLGSAAVLLAAPDIDDVGGLVVDAVLPELEQVFHNLTASERFGLPQPWRWLTLRAIELLSGFDVDDVRPVDAAARLPADLPALVIAAGDDFRTPPELVRRVYDALPSPDRVKQYWVDEAASHGKVFDEAPEEYRAALAQLVARMLAGR